MKKKLLLRNSVLAFGSTGNIAKEYEQNGYEVKMHMAEAAKSHHTNCQI